LIGDEGIIGDEGLATHGDKGIVNDDEADMVYKVMTKTQSIRLKYCLNNVDQGVPSCIDPALGK
jgi:hypothetical protein